MASASKDGSPLRVGIVGGNAERAWAHDAHVPALATLPQFKLAAVSARNQELADKAAAAFGAPRAFGDSLKLVRDPDIDVVAVTVKVPEHRAIVLAALEAGKHLYCEWPLGRDALEAEEMAQAAARAESAHVIIGLQALSAPAVRHAAKLAASGALGQLRMLRVVSPTAGWGPKAPPYYEYLQDKRNGATLLSIAGGHTIAAMEALAGPYTELDARSGIFHKQIELVGTGRTVERTCPDQVMVIGQHASGCVSTLEVLGGQKAMPFRMELFGSAGTLSITARHSWLGGFQVNVLDCQTSVASDPVPPDASPTLKGPPANVAETYVRLLEDIRNGAKTVPEFRLAVALTRTLDAIEAASDSGRRMRLANGEWMGA
jgi:predicted dehydrogenase